MYYKKLVEVPVLHCNSSFPIFIVIVFNASLSWSFCESKSSQVSRTLQSILADFNSAVVFFRSFGDSFKCPKYNWYHRHPNVITIIIIIIAISLCSLVGFH